ncbi:MAG TPA: diguanylate cyclase, partial [Candidatus Limnocylindrales bacterium]
GVAGLSRAPRVFARLARSLWIRDRALAELRWAAVSLIAMASLAILGKVLDPLEDGFDVALVVTIPLAIALTGLAWSPAAPRAVRLPGVRYLVGPAMLAIGALAMGVPDLVTLAPPSAAPLILVALSFAAVTPGLPLAVGLYVLFIAGIWIAHELVIGPTAPDVVRDEFFVGALVGVMIAIGMYIVVRIATEAEARAFAVAERDRRRADDLETLESIVARFDGTRPLAEVYQRVVDDVSRDFDITLVSLYLPTSPGRLSMVGVAGYHSPFHELSVGVGIIGRAASTLETQYLEDVFQDPDYKAARDDVRSEVAVPIVHDGELLGVLNFEGTAAAPIRPRHVAVAEMLARAISAALRSARLDQERRDRLHAIERVLEVGRGLVSDLDRSRTLHAVVDTAADLLATESVLIAGRDADGRYLIEHQVPTSDRLGEELDVSETAALQAVVTGQPATTDDERSTLAIPIGIDDEVAAVLVAVRPAGADPFGPLEARIADLLATQVAVALRNADRHARVSDAAVRDPLTGLLNRRYFDEAVEAAFASARRSGLPLSLIVLDLDRFSSVNNEHGHAVGDAVLRRVARAMAAAVRTGDTVARYGGEEFVVIAPGADAEAAVEVAERIREAVVAATCTPIDGTDVPVTVSAGVASLIGDELDGQALFRAADSALLAAKRAGRDRVVTV